MRYLFASVVAFSLLAVGFVTVPNQAQAAGLTSAQVSAVIQLLQSFGADQTIINNVQTALGGSSTPSTNASCLTLSYNLYAGLTDSSTNGQVSQLQQFLGVSSVTGYFGPMTQQAVQNWQASHNIVSSGSPDTTGYGFVGPATRSAMACSNQSTTNTGASVSTNGQNDVTANLKKVQTAEAAFNVNVLNEMVLYVNETNAYSGTDIPNLKAFANQWGPTLLTMQSQLQTLQQSNLTTVFSSDLASMIATYMQSGSEFNQALAAFNALPSSELATLGTGRVSTTSNPSCASPTILLPTANGGVTITPGQQTGKLLEANQQVTWSVQNLPTWATLNTTNGVDATTGLPSSETTIQYGVSSTPGTYTMTVVATNSCGAQASVPFTVNVFGVVSTTPPTTAAVPYPVSLSPSQGTVGSQVIITGTGFVTTGGNTILFDGVSLGSANAVNGTLNFTIPSIIYPSCSNSSCAGTVITPGAHYVTVQNANGQSGLKLLFTVLSSGGASAAITPQNLTTLSGYPVTLQGTASGATQVIVDLSTPQSGTVWNSGPIAVTNGQWSVTTAPLQSGTYTVTVVQAGGNGTALATGTLTAQ